MLKRLGGRFVFVIGLCAVGTVAGFALLARADSAVLIVLGCVLAAVGISGLTLINTRQVKSIQSLARVIVEAQENQEQQRKDTLRYTSAVEYRTRDLKRILSQLQTTANSTRYHTMRQARAAVPKTSNVPFDGVSAASGTSPITADAHGPTAPRVSRPNGIKALTPKPQATGEAAGRLAAAVDRDARREGILRGLLTPTEKTGANPRSLTVLLGGSDLAERLQEATDVVELTPSFITIPADASYVVIDESALHSGVWSSTTSAVGTRRFATLQRELRAAKNRGTAVVILKSERSTGNFEQDLRSQADLVISSNGHETGLFGWADDIATPIITILNQFARGSESA